MMQLIEILGLAFLACLLMGTILGYFGMHVLKREIIFVDIALAQIAAVGAIAAHLAFGAHGDSLLASLCSLGCVISVAAFYAVVRRRVIQISLEAIIGVSYAIAAAAALFLVGIAPGGHVHVQQILSGSLLWTTPKDIVTSLLVFSAVGFACYLFRRPLSRTSNESRKSRVEGKNTALWDFFFYVLLGGVITVAVRVAGVVVVFAYLIIPATIALIFSSNRNIQLIITWSAAIAGSIGGLLFAYCLDFSVGPSVALLLGVELVIASLISKSCQTTHFPASGWKNQDRCNNSSQDTATGTMLQ